MECLALFAMRFLVVIYISCAIIVIFVAPRSEYVSPNKGSFFFLYVMMEGTKNIEYVECAITE